MNQIKEHLDKIVAAVIIVACLGLIAKTHLSERQQAVSIEEIDRVLDIVEGDGPRVAVAPIPKFGTEFEASMARLDGNLPSGLSGWKFYASPDCGGPPPEKNWTLVAKVFGPAERAGADAEVRTLRGKIKVDGGVFVHEPEPRGGGFWACAGKFTSATDPEVEPVRQKLIALQYTNVVPKDLKAGIRPPVAPPGILALPEMKVKGVYMGKAELAALFSARDANYSVKLLQVWRRKAGEEKWPTAPLFTLTVTVEGNKTTVVPPKGASGDQSGLAITQLKLPAREAYEYRARAAAGFPKKVKLAEGLDLQPAPKELAALLKGESYVTKFTAPVKIETPGEVQIQFSGEMLMSRKRYGNFRLKRWMTGSSEPVTHMMRFLLGKRIKASVNRHIGGKTVRVVFDSEAILVSMATEMREVWGWKWIMVPDPETGVLVRKKVKYRKPDKKVKVAIIKDVRTGKTHKLDRSGGDKGWWPKGLAVQAAPVPTPDPTPTPVVGPPSRRGPVNGTSSRRGPVVIPKKPKTPVKPKVTPATHPPTDKPVTPKRPRQPRETPPPPPDPEMDPGPRPKAGDAKALEAWETKKKEHEEWLRSNRSGGMK